jgi:hypothetical protein
MDDFGTAPPADSLARHLTADAAAMAECLARVRRDEAAAMPVLDDAGRDRLRRAADSLAFRPATPVVGQGEKAVTQDFEICPDPPRESVWTAVAGALAALVDAGLARMAAPPCPPVTFNETVVQRYGRTGCGISPHRDHLRYINLVGILVIDGAGSFHVCDDRAGTNARPIPAGAGSLLLMRAPGFDGSRHRPFHMLGEVHEPRLILGLRQDTRPGEAD